MENKIEVYMLNQGVNLVYLRGVSEDKIASEEKRINSLLPQSITVIVVN